MVSSIFNSAAYPFSSMELGQRSRYCGGFPVRMTAPNVQHAFFFFFRCASCSKCLPASEAWFVAPWPTYLGVTGSSSGGGPRQTFARQALFTRAALPEGLQSTAPAIITSIVSAGTANFRQLHLLNTPSCKVSPSNIERKNAHP